MSGHHQRIKRKNGSDLFVLLGKTAPNRDVGQRQPGLRPGKRKNSYVIQNNCREEAQDPATVIVIQLTAAGQLHR